VIERSFDVTFFNRIANHPDVRPWIGGKGVLDLTDAVMNIGNFALKAEGGGFILIQHEPGIYEAHSLFPPEGRRHSIRAMRDGFDYMFSRTDCERIVTQVPDDNAPAQALAKLAKFRPMFRREEAERGPTAYVSLSLDDWAMETASLEKDGAWFHDGMEAAKKRFNSSLPGHPHDPAHERAVGAAVRMVKAGNIDKAIAYYHRWSRFAGYPPLIEMSRNPLVFDVGAGVVATMIDGNMEVLLCP
jgi:hypothetical protein